jgi:hypothetical protein
MRRCVWLMLMMIGSTNFDVCDDRSGITSTRMTIKGEFGWVLSLVWVFGSGR